MATNYNGNLVKLRERRSKIIIKRTELKNQLNEHIPLKERNGILNKINLLTKEIDKIDTEIRKVQKGMQNSNKWMDGTFNFVDILNN